VRGGPGLQACYARREPQASARVGCGRPCHRRSRFGDRLPRRAARRSLAGVVSGWACLLDGSLSSPLHLGICPSARRPPSEMSTRARLSWWRQHSRTTFYSHTSIDHRRSGSVSSARAMSGTSSGRVSGRAPVCVAATSASVLWVWSRPCEEFRTARTRVPT
jgi:hypothetical protein